MEVFLVYDCNQKFQARMHPMLPPSGQVRLPLFSIRFRWIFGKVSAFFSLLFHLLEVVSFERVPVFWARLVCTLTGLMLSRRESIKIVPDWKRVERPRPERMKKLHERRWAQTLVCILLYHTVTDRLVFVIVASFVRLWVPASDHPTAVESWESFFVVPCCFLLPDISRYKILAPATAQPCSISHILLHWLILDEFIKFHTCLKEHFFYLRTIYLKKHHPGLSWGRRATGTIPQTHGNHSINILSLK
jgi:hypothetical protein